jgi:hypothetical protein
VINPLSPFFWMQKVIKMVRLLRIIICAALLCGLFTCLPCRHRQALAEAATVAVGSVNGSPGETILVPVNIDGLAGQTSCNISVAFDKKRLKYIGRENGNMGAGVMGPKLADANKRGKYDPIVSFMGEAQAGTIMYLKFTVREGAKGDIPLTLTVPTPAGVFNTVSGKIMVR